MISPEYDVAYDFSEVLAEVEVGELTGFTKSRSPSASSPWRTLLQDLSGANSYGNLTQ